MKPWCLLEQEITTPAAPPKVTDIRQDLARFDSLFGLPVAQLQVVNSLARSPSPWLADEEEVEDTEIVHAVAPKADIREILVSDSDRESTAATVKYGLAALRLGVATGRGDLREQQQGRVLLHAGRDRRAECRRYRRPATAT